MKRIVKQIIPAPAGMQAHFENNDTTDPNGLYDINGKLVAYSEKVICLALTEVTDRTGTYNAVEPMVLVSDGYLELVSESGNLLSVTND